MGWLEGFRFIPPDQAFVPFIPPAKDKKEIARYYCKKFDAVAGSQQQEGISVNSGKLCSMMKTEAMGPVTPDQLNLTGQQVLARFHVLTVQVKKVNNGQIKLNQQAAKANEEGRKYIEQSINLDEERRKMWEMDTHIVECFSQTMPNDYKNK